jgi:hypothetical protein
LTGHGFNNTPCIIIKGSINTRVDLIIRITTEEYIIADPEARRPRYE